MRLVKLKKEPIRVEGKYGIVIIKAEPDHISVSTIPDTECEANVFFIMNISSTTNFLKISKNPEGYKISMEKRP